MTSWNLEKKLLLFIKKVLVNNISNARHVFIRVPLKILLIIFALAMRFLCGSVQSKTKVEPLTVEINHDQAKPSQQSSPTSISAILNTSDQSISMPRKSTYSRDSRSAKYSIYSVIRSKSSSSLVNYFTPDYTLEAGEKNLNDFSDIGSNQINEILFDETDLDCDSLESSFYYDLKTHSSEKNSFLSYQQDHFNNEKNKMNNNANGSVHNSSGLPDLINQKGNKDVPTDKARKYLEGLDGVKFNEVQVPDTLKKQLEYFDRDELLQLIAYQKKYLDFKETRIKDLENYIDNLVVKIIETEPLILMNASNVLTKSKNVI